MVFPSNLDVCDCLLREVQKGMPVVHVKRLVCDCGHTFASKKRKARCTAVGEPENAMKRRKALLSEEELLVTKERDKVHKASKRASETREQTLHRQEQNQTARVLHFSAVHFFSKACPPIYGIQWNLS